MLNHITLKVSNLENSRKWYEEALKPLGYKLLHNKETSAGFGQQDTEGTRDFWIKEGEVSETKSFSCLAFTATGKETVKKFYETALKAADIDNGAPDYRPEYHPGYYAAFVLDPDGYNIEVVWDDLKKLKVAD